MVAALMVRKVSPRASQADSSRKSGGFGGIPHGRARGQELASLRPHGSDGRSSRGPHSFHEPS